MTPVSKSLALAAWFFKRNSGVFVSCPSAVPSPSPQLNYFFPFLKEALRWKERHLGFMMFHVVGLLFFFKELLFAWLGAFTQCCCFFFWTVVVVVPTLRSSGFGSQSPENTRLWLFTGQRTSAVSWSFFSGTGGSCLSPFGQLYKIIADWVTYKQTNLFLTLLEAGSPRSGGQHGWVLVEALFQVADCPPLAVSSRAGKGRGVLWESLSLIKGHSSHS